MAGTEYRRVTLSGPGGDFTLTEREIIGDRVESVLTNVKGWYGGVGVDAEKTQRSLGHGLFPSATRRTGRSITVEGTLVFREDADRLIADRFVSGLLWDGDEGTLTVETGQYTLSTTVKIDGEIGHAYRGTKGIDVQIPLIAVDPFLYAPVETVQVYPAGAGVGLRFPLFGDADHPGVLSFGKANPNTRAVIQNMGNATEYPVIRVCGDLPSGFTLRDSRGRTISYPAPVWSQSPVEVDSRLGAVFQGGMDQTYRATRRDWFSIEAGGVNSFTITSAQDGDGYAEIQHRSTYI